METDGTRKRHRARNNGVRKLCGCARSKWPRCPHAWYFNFKMPHGDNYQFSIDREVGRHIETKEEAIRLAEEFRVAIRAGSFVRAADRAKQAATKVSEAQTGVTLTKFADIFVERVAQASGKRSWKNDRDNLKRLCAFRRYDGTFLGDATIATITEDELEAFLIGLRRAGRAASTRNGYVQVIKRAFRWAARKGYIEKSPVSEETTLRRETGVQRNRRLVADVVDDKGRVVTAGEERRLLAVAGPLLQNLVIGALETGCRRGELLKLQWRDVDLQKGELKVRAENAKDDDERELPISMRLMAVLKMIKTAPNGKDYEPDSYVFGELGEQIKNIKKAWETAVLKSHGVEPIWRRGGLSPESRAALRQINLHFHDLRHEAGSRWLEAGWPLHKVRDMLGHSSIDQTDTYLNTSKRGLHEEMRRMDEARSRCNSVVIETTIEHPVAHNEASGKPDKVSVN